MTGNGRKRPRKPRPPAQPTQLTVTQPTASTARLAWADNSVDELVFHLERSVAGAAFTVFAIVPQNIVTYTDTGLLEGTTYSYRVRAVNDYGVSPYTNTVSLTTASTAPPAPTQTGPTAALTVTTAIVTLGTNVVVSTVGTIPGSSALNTWELAWGDGQFDRGSGVPTGTLSHAYGSIGSKTITLTVTDANTLSDDAQGSASVLAAPPAPVPGTTIAEYVFTSTGWATFGLVAPQGQVPAAVKVGALTTQTNVKTTWGDGSSKHMIVTAKILATGTQTITTIANPGGSLTPTWPSASVVFVTSAGTYTATLPSFDGTDTWLNGALCREARKVVVPTTGGGSQHALLQVIYDVRMYSDGAYRVDVCVQNVKNSTSGNAVAYNVTVNVGGSAVYTKSSVTHAYMTRWRKTFVSATEATLAPDLAPFYTAGAMPEFVSTVTNPVYPAVTGSTYDILTWGDMTSYMPAPGGRPEIGFYPDWTARYLAHKTPTTRAYMLKHADLSGSWSGHLCASDGVTLISIDDLPDFFLDPRGVAPNGPASVTGTTEYLENAHLPTLTYVPYLITGDRYYLDQTKFWANFAILSTPPSDPTRPRGGADAILSQNQIRGMAWGLRALAEAAAACPDADTKKAYFTAKLQKNLDYIDGYSKSPPSGISFGALEIVNIAIPYHPFGSFVDEGDYYYPSWQFGYLAFALDYCKALGFSDATHLRNRLARFQLRLLNSEPDYDRDFGAPYYAVVGTVDTTPATWVWTPFTSMATIMTRTFGSPSPGQPPNPLPTHYGPIARAVLQIAVRNAETGASSTLAWLEAYPGLMDGVNAQAGFALKGPIVSASYGPQRGITASAPYVTIAPGESWVTKTAANPAGTTFRILAGVHSFTADHTPKAGNSYIGDYGAILDGTLWSTSDVDASPFRAVNNGVTNVTVRNLEIREMPSYGVNAYLSASGWTVDYCEIHHCRTGVSVGIDGVITNNSIHHNTGDPNASDAALRGGGYSCNSSLGASMVHNEIAYNGSEQKFIYATLNEPNRNLTITDNWFHHNEEDGCWIDGDGDGSTVARNVCEDNGRTGITIEIGDGVTVSDNICRRNGEEGILLSASRSCTVTGNTVQDNLFGIGLFLDFARLAETYIWTVELQDNVITGNTVRVLSGSTFAALLTFTGVGDQTPYLNNTRNNDFDENDYDLPNTTDAKFVWNGNKTFTQWQALPQDPNGSVS